MISQLHTNCSHSPVHSGMVHVHSGMVHVHLWRQYILDLELMVHAHIGRLTLRPCDVFIASFFGWYCSLMGRPRSSISRKSNEFGVIASWYTSSRCPCRIKWYTGQCSEAQKQTASTPLASRPPFHPKQTSRKQSWGLKWQGAHIGRLPLPVEPLHSDGLSGQHVNGCGGLKAAPPNSHLYARIVHRIRKGGGGG